ncbi:Protein CBG26085 [Caenorhabditis briggsae]|uniref:Protein CBG26085 n=1 Tax=Caenorhabditis briggsae TaxID=6238 RepID=B6IJJ5_CAEBR|nr:Protein CBG26085 [Caenorhabditis briggsae]CAS00075.1 Protein CBG26085 [Caenorhabditis briggsae]
MPAPSAPLTHTIHPHTSGSAFPSSSIYNNAYVDCRPFSGVWSSSVKFPITLKILEKVKQT